MTRNGFKNPLFRHLKSLPRESINLWSMCRCASAISPQEFSLQREKYRGLGPAVNRSVHGIKNRFSCLPLLYHDHRAVCEYRSHGTKVLSRKDIVNIRYAALGRVGCVKRGRGKSRRVKRWWVAAVVWGGLISYEHVSYDSRKEV